MRHCLWLFFRLNMNFCHLLPHNWGPKTWSKDTVGIFPRDLLRAPTGDPVESGPLESQQRSHHQNNGDIMGFNQQTWWVVQWISWDILGISFSHLRFTRCSKHISKSCVYILIFMHFFLLFKDSHVSWMMLHVFFMEAPSPPHLLSPNGACSPSRLGRVATSGLLHRVWAAWSAPWMVPDGACWTHIVTPKNMDR